MSSRASAWMCGWMGGFGVVFYGCKRFIVGVVKVQTVSSCTTSQAFCLASSFGLYFFIVAQVVQPRGIQMDWAA